MGNQSRRRSLLGLALALGCLGCGSPAASPPDAAGDAALDAGLDDASTDSARADSGPLPPPVCPTRDASIPEPPTVPVTVVRLDRGSPGPLQLAVQACAGLRNRAAGGSVYVDSNPQDAAWLTDLGITPAATLSAQEFLTSCVTEVGTCVRYDYAAQRALLPNILTVAAVLGAVPVDGSLGVTCGATAFDAIAELRDQNTAALATRYVFDRFGAQTTGLAMLNPGYEQAPVNPATPAITRDMGPALVDYVFAQRLFVVFLINGCTEGDPENALLSSIVNAGQWPTPLPVYGYNNSWFVLGGYLHEAQTRCLGSRNMGAIASETNNLSFFSTRAAPITGPGRVVQNPPETVEYDPSRTYVAFVIGDGDNLEYMLNARRQWFLQRVAACAPGAACPTLNWTISSHLARLAPDVLRWYYDQSHRTGHDYFTLPPSGHLYAYPSSLAGDAQDRFVTATAEDGCTLGVTGTVHWDYDGTWRDAEQTFLPKYATLGSPIRGIFPVNVPYLLPTFTWWPASRFFEILTGPDGGAVALFKPRSWRGVDSETDRFKLTPTRMATEIGAYPRGTITWVYMTSDGGLNLENSFLAIAGLLPPHVQLVSTDTAARLALESGR